MCRGFQLQEKPRAEKNKRDTQELSEGKRQALFHWCNVLFHVLQYKPGGEQYHEEPAQKNAMPKSGAMLPPASKEQYEQRAVHSGFIQLHRVPGDSRDGDRKVVRDGGIGLRDIPRLCRDDVDA